MSRRSFPDDVKLRVLKLAQSGKSITDICHLNKIPEKTVRNLLREYGVSASHGSHKHIDVSARTEFIRLYTEEHMKPAEIARHTGYSETSVRKTIRSFKMNEESKSDCIGLFSVAKESNDSDSIDRTVSQLAQQEDEPDIQYDCDDCEEYFTSNIRKLRTIQKFYKLNEVYSYDEQGIGNAHHVYLIHPADDDPTIEGEHECYARIIFQNGPRYESGSTQGVIDSDLLEIIRDRLTDFQNGEYACPENANALRHIEEALFWMNLRVEKRAERGVLGTSNK